MSNSNVSQTAGQKKAVTIIVNGRRREVTGKTVSYEGSSQKTEKIVR